MSDKLTKGENYKGFVVLNVFEVKDYHSTAYHLRHKKTGLEVFHLANNDRENLFAFAFRTPNKEANGAAHIMEHSVLCGSEKYPLKDPFTQLANQSVKTYLNAATYPDKTVYPASSIIKADYFNLMSVYGDAVFFPKLQKEIFMQEAHRLEIDKGGNPSIQGVVYNEMKGCYSSFDDVFMDAAPHAMLKGTIFEKDSGGDPLDIPSLTYEKYLEFHKTWYRPDNCFIFLYGDIPTTEQLDFLQDNILTRLEAKNPDYKWSEENNDERIKKHLELCTAKKLEKPISIKEFGPAGEKDEQLSTVVLTWDMGVSTTAYEDTEKNLLAGILLNNDGSPLQKALQETDLGEDTAPGMGCRELYTTLFSIGMRGVKSSNVDKIKDLIFNTLENVVSKGISEEDIDSTLMGYELMHRTVKSNPGLYLKNRPITAWVYGYDIEKSFKLRSVLESVKERIKNEKGYLENLVKKYFIDNKAYCVSEIIPSEKYTEERNQKEQELINCLLKQTTIDNVKQQNEQLHIFQAKKDDVSCLPHLKPGDFLPEVKKLCSGSELKVESIKGKNNENVDFLVSCNNTNKISYISVAYPADYLDIEDYPWVPLFSETVCDCGWGNLDWAKAAQIAAIKTGGFTAAIFNNSFCTAPSGLELASKYKFCGRDYIMFKLCVIDEYLEEGLKLLADNLNLVDFHDLKRISDIAVEMRNDVESSVVDNGHFYAKVRAGRKNGRDAAMDELWKGLTFVKNLRQQTEEAPEKIAERFRKMLAKLKQGGGFIHVNAEKETLEKSKSIFENFAVSIGLTQIKEEKIKTNEEILSLTDIDGKVEEGKTECFVVPGQSGFASESFLATPYGSKMNSVEVVCTHWLSDILLWERIRTIGGAYGGFCDTETISGNLFFASYRDPSPELSNDVFDQSLEDAAKIDFTNEDVEKAVMGSFSRFAKPRTPVQEGSAALMNIICCITEEERIKKIENILKTTKEDVRQCFENLSNLSKQQKYRVIIGSKKSAKGGKVVVLPL